ncbi:RagB/SusD family nutrient uptake outer membrane protein [Litoribacter alkaliphilus]|uniref:RagB/SusD family nutrient uptake outer membrane protein n=1 Tax=Litoribacter ruber TaxID=702568 RepID=A0AAP2CJI4_9BACT|nr:RagB/SusD family nutrient uptake outer membrane protein [Litoribacter alkaliphilus]MBS9525332.1 RagB/SusD family nutrient uptake outer membrane protein [Litoribacter alkaliphilus]
MKNIIQVLFVGGLLFASSCNEDLLSPIPPTTFSEAVVFDTPERIQQTLNGLYSTMINGQFYGGRYQVYNDIRAEEFSNRTTNGVTGLATWQHTVVSTTNEVENLWSIAYLTINRANIFIDGVSKSTVLEAETAQNYIAQARFIRGLSYFALLQLYAQPFTANNGASPGLPLRLTPELDNANNDMPRSTVAEVYAQILADLNFAETNLALNNGSPYNNTTRAHRNTAIALKTRVYMAMGQYGNVILEANKIVSATAPFTAASGVGHALQEEILDVFSPPYTTTESILSAPFTELALPGTQNGLGSYYNPGPRGIGDYSLNMTGGIFTNPAFNAANDARSAWMFANANGFTYLNKFPRGPQHLDFAPIIRYSEVLLNLAEALVRDGGDQSRALALLNAVRTRSNENGAYTGISGQALIDAILSERRIEFIGEGLRSFDLLRTGQDIPAKENVGAVARGSSNYIWPMSANELLFNKAMTPNN